MYGPRPRGNPNFNRNQPNGPRSAFLGNSARYVQPAWKKEHQLPKQKPERERLEGGSKVFIVGLPLDVERDAISELMESTVGPLREAFCVYNMAGKPTGMAVVHFTHPTDAAKARTLYNMKIIDQRKPISVEIIGAVSPAGPYPHTSGPTQAPPPPPPQRSLLDRLENLGKTMPHKARQQNFVSNLQQQNARTVQNQARGKGISAAQLPPAPKQRRKKGPKRVQKVLRQKTAEELDAEMEIYRSEAPEK